MHVSYECSFSFTDLHLPTPSTDLFSDLDSPQSPDPSPPLPLTPPPTAPPPPASLLDSQLHSEVSPEEWIDESESLLPQDSIIPVPYPFREDWQTFSFPDPAPPSAHFLDSTQMRASLLNSVRGVAEDAMADLPQTPAAEAPQPPPPSAQRRESQRARRREKLRRRAAAKEKARVCHDIFCRLPR